MTLNDLEWPFYVKFSLLRTAVGQTILTYLLYRCLSVHVTTGDVRKRSVIRRIFGIRGKLPSGRRYIVGTLTNKVNISI